MQDTLAGVNTYSAKYAGTMCYYCTCRMAQIVTCIMRRMTSETRGCVRMSLLTGVCPFVVLSHQSSFHVSIRYIAKYAQTPKAHRYGK